jgi:hypothetical protein
MCVLEMAGPERTAMPATAAGLPAPVDALADQSGWNDGRVRKVKSGVIHTFAGGSAIGYLAEGGPATDVATTLDRQPLQEIVRRTL